MSKPTLDDLLKQALLYEYKAFDEDDAVNGGDMVEWFGRWRLLLKDAIQADPVAAVLVRQVEAHARLDRAEEAESIASAAHEARQATDADLDAARAEMNAALEEYDKVHQEEPTGHPVTVWVEGPAVSSQEEAECIVDKMLTGAMGAGDGAPEGTTVVVVPE